jgi:hypothetical protein
MTMVLQDVNWTDARKAVWVSAQAKHNTSAGLSG